MKNKFPRALVAVLMLLVAAAASADPAPPSSGDQLLSGLDPSRWRVALPDAAAASPGVIFDLPAETVAPSATLQVALTNGTRVHVEETIVLPSEISSEPTIEFLASHPRELARIRTAAAKKPGLLRVQVWADGRQIVDMPFVEADRGSDGTVVGSSESVIVRLRDPRRLNMTYGPCEDDCDQAFYECFLVCDERGAGCPWCHEQYDDCLWECSH